MSSHGREAEGHAESRVAPGLPGGGERPSPSATPKATQMLWHGIDVREAKLWHKAWAEQGAPTMNRAEKRKTAKAKRRAKNA